MRGSHLYKQCGIQDPVEPSIEVDGGTSGPASTLLGNCLEQAALRRE
jgi:hypothetical protein